MDNVLVCGDSSFWFIANGQAWGIVNVGGGIICRLLNKKPK